MLLPNWTDERFFFRVPNLIAVMASRHSQKETINSKRSFIIGPLQSPDIHRTVSGSIAGLSIPFCINDRSLRSTRKKIQQTLSTFYNHRSGPQMQAINFLCNLHVSWPTVMKLIVIIFHHSRTYVVYEVKRLSPICAKAIWWQKPDVLKRGEGSVFQSFLLYALPSDAISRSIRANWSAASSAALIVTFIPNLTIFLMRLTHDSSSWLSPGFPASWLSCCYCMPCVWHSLSPTISSPSNQNEP